MKFDAYLNEFIDFALREDVGDGDHTSLATIPSDAIGNAQLLVKENGILAGSSISEKIFKKLHPESKFEQLINDGASVRKGDVAFKVRGHVQAILLAERLVLNIMQRMSGIATQTSIYVDAVSGLKTKILDTRKTAPGMRLLDKLAVKTGGGENHRVGLYDMVLIKDNHIDFAGGIEKAISRTIDYLKANNKNLSIEIEARSINDVKRILQVGGIQRIMLDNFSLSDTREAVKIIDNVCETESSGGITLGNLRQYAECGVDYISVGALTHQVRSLDLSLKAIDF